MTDPSTDTKNSYKFTDDLPSHPHVYKEHKKSKQKQLVGEIWLKDPRHTGTSKPYVLTTKLSNGWKTWELIVTYSPIACPESSDTANR